VQRNRMVAILIMFVQLLQQLLSTKNEPKMSLWKLLMEFHTYKSKSTCIASKEIGKEVSLQPALAYLIQPPTKMIDDRNDSIW